ncbi:cupin domain-containing protein [Caballeronia sp. LZ062]|uniref:cupin domain-containing protein n=1 Tax=unclassified Caballeronia TaxID=2646786 RepID=UPI00286088E8|nr:MULTISPECIES: cupin domain-containing protein [unclassified Caballeronia]MDR5854567.1 cupin domain-containing protein [Caballeronia sp. LZ050]MDR5870904.1 cupin domain-containing protein [Caballeronia sp. LZ062]
MAEHTETVQAANARCESFLLATNGWVPNNARLPVLVWHGAIDPQNRDCGSRFEALFAQNGWPPQWRDSVFDYHHFHSTAHEALGVASGEAELIIGGPEGRVIALRAGDALVLPAGTGHCLLTSARRFQVIGAYPPDQQWDIRRDALSDDERRAMEALPFPKSDPVAGEDGPLTRLWR